MDIVDIIGNSTAFYTARPGLASKIYKDQT